LWVLRHNTEMHGRRRCSNGVEGGLQAGMAMYWLWSRFGWRLGGLALLIGSRALAQVPIVGQDGTLRLNGSDMAVLETQDVRKDLPCTVEPVKPVLGFDLRFHGGYGISIPLKEIAGPENQLTILFRVTPKSRKDDPSYFVQYIPVRKIEEDSK
jgi:hypothetical protein